MRIEYANQRKIREKNKAWYRVAHCPIWIWVFFLAPGPLTFDLFAHGASIRNWRWLFFVMAATALAGVFGQLPGVEPRPYILRFCEYKPNPLYRRICYAFAWNALVSFAVLNLIGLAVAISTGHWRLKQIYDYGYLPIFLVIMLCGICGLLPRVKPSTKNEGIERRYFYSAVWSITTAQSLLLAMWKTLPRTHAADVLKLSVYLVSLLAIAAAAVFGFLPRTRPILPGELMIAD
jgi:hypothetical protein